MGKDKNEFNDLAAEAREAGENGGVMVDFRATVDYFNGLAQKQQGETQPTVTQDQEFGARLETHVRGRMKDMVDTHEREKMEAVSKPHAQKVKTVAARRKNKTPGAS